MIVMSIRLRLFKVPQNVYPRSHCHNSASSWSVGSGSVVSMCQCLGSQQQEIMYIVLSLFRLTYGSFAVRIVFVPNKNRINLENTPVCCCSPIGPHTLNAHSWTVVRKVMNALTVSTCRSFQRNILTIQEQYEYLGPKYCRTS